MRILFILIVNCEPDPRGLRNIGPRALLRHKCQLRCLVRSMNGVPFSKLCRLKNFSQRRLQHICFVPDTMYLLTFFAYLFAVVVCVQPEAPAPVPAPLRELPWGQLNFLHTTDTHGWFGGHLQELALLCEACCLLVAANLNVEHHIPPIGATTSLLPNTSIAKLTATVPICYSSILEIGSKEMVFTTLQNPKGNIPLTLSSNKTSIWSVLATMSYTKQIRR